MSMSSGSRVRRLGTIAMSSKPYARRPFFPRPISTSMAAILGSAADEPWTLATVFGPLPDRRHTVLPAICGDLPKGLLAALLADGAHLVRHLLRRAWALLDLEPAAVAEQPSETAISHLDLDAEAALGLVPPLVDVGHPAERHREPERDPSLVEALLAGAQAQSTAVVHGEVDVHRQVLMRPQVVDDPTALIAPDHRRVERQLAPAHPEAPRPGDRLTPERVDVRVVGDRERYVAAVAGHEDPPPRAQPQERHRPPGPAPHLLHDACADLDDAVGAAQPEAALDLRVQAVEVGAESACIDRSRHAGGALRQRRADGASERRRKDHAARSDRSGGTPSSIHRRSRS